MDYVNPQFTPLSADDVLLVPQYGILRSRQDAVVSAGIYSAPMDTVTGYDLTGTMLENEGCPVLCRNLPDEEWLSAVEEFHHHPNFWIATDAKLEKLDLLGRLVLRKKINVAVDIAHGHSVVGLEAVRELVNRADVQNIMSGSIATGFAAHVLEQAGATHLRIGIGPGSACTTRLMTGVGVPQLTAVAQAASCVNHAEIIADGGIRNPGDAVKYLAAGASGFMMGGVFSRTRESAGWVETPAGPRKSYRGHASASFQKDHFGKAHQCPEGASGPHFIWDGETTVETVLAKYRGGIASACSYLGVSSSSELIGANFIRNTTSGIREGQPHGTI